MFNWLDSEKQSQKRSRLIEQLPPLSVKVNDHWSLLMWQTRRVTYRCAETWFSMHCSQNVCKHVKHFGSLNGSCGKRREEIDQKNECNRLWSLTYQTYFACEVLIVDLFRETKDLLCHVLGWVGRCSGKGCTRSACFRWLKWISFVGFRRQNSKERWSRSIVHFFSVLSLVGNQSVLLTFSRAPLIDLTYDQMGVRVLLLEIVNNHHSVSYQPGWSIQTKEISLSLSACVSFVSTPMKSITRAAEIFTRGKDQRRTTAADRRWQGYSSAWRNNRQTKLTRKISTLRCFAFQSLIRMISRHVSIQKRMPTRWLILTNHDENHCSWPWLLTLLLLLLHLTRSQAFDCF